MEQDTALCGHKMEIVSVLEITTVLSWVMISESLISRKTRCEFHNIFCQHTLYMYMTLYMYINNSILLERFSFECREVIGFALSAPHDWLKIPAPLFHPIRSTGNQNQSWHVCMHFPALCISYL